MPTEPRRYLICGSRGWTDRDAIYRELRVLPPNTVVIHGAARGADTIAGEIAGALGLIVECYPADWKRWGKAAGVIRNGAMLLEGRPDRVIAFAADLTVSRGTADMVDRARRAGIPTTVISA